MFRLRMTVCLLLISITCSYAGAETIKIATISPDGLSWMQKLRAGVKEIDTKTNSRVKFKIYPGGVQGDDSTVLRKMRIGQLHGGAVAAGSLTRFYPDLQIYNLPLQFRSYAEVDYVRGKMDPMIEQGLEASGIVTFTFTETGFAYLLSGTPVKSVADLKQIKAWIPDGDPISAELIKAFDVSPIPLNITDVLAGLQTGLIDAVVAPPVVALALQWHNQVKYVMNLPLMYIYSTLALNETTWDKIAPADQAIVISVMNRLFREIDTDNRIGNEKAYAALLSSGLIEVKPDAARIAEWRAVADQSIGNLVQSGEVTASAVQTYLDNLQNYRNDHSNLNNSTDRDTIDTAQPRAGSE